MTKPYTYDTNKKHAVTQVANTDTLIQGAASLTYNAFNKVATVVQGTNTLTITYGPDHQRTKTVLVNGSNTTTTLYADNYEQRTANGVTTSYHYVASPDGLAAVYVKSGNTATAYYIETDHLGSIVRAYDYIGNTKFSAAYDAWGNQTVSTNAIGLTRGYTGHEHWPQFGLIDMNGRFYDPLLGRFLSPDPYVQAPENPQNYNRYAYCLNNPLKYTDPSGNIVMTATVMGIFISAYMGAIINVGAQGVAGNVNSVGDFFLYSGIGSLAGFAGGYAGMAVSGLGNIASSAVSGAVSNFINGAGNTWANGGSLGEGFATGGLAGLKGGISGGLTSAALGGTSALLGNGRIPNAKINIPKAELSNLELDGSILLDQVDVIAYNYHSYAKATMNIFNQIWGTDYSLVSGNNLLAKMWFHYQCGMREPVFVDATTLNLGKIRQDDIKINGINLYKKGGVFNQTQASLTFGKVSVQSYGDNLYAIESDTYNFNIEKINGKGNLYSIFHSGRNFGTACSGVLHQNWYSSMFGGDFEIYPVGLITILP